MKTNLNIKKAFTAVELTVVMLIAGILAALAMPSLGSWISSITAQSKANTLMAAINKARSESLARNQAIVFVMNDTGYWQYGCVRVNTDVNSSAYCPSSILEKNSELTDNKTTITMSPSGANYIVFNNLGMPVNNATYGANRLTSLSLTSSSSNTYNIVLRSGGSAKMCIGTCS